MTPKRIQRKRTKGWRMPADAVYVGRPSRWGNPFRIYHGHSVIGPSWALARSSWAHLLATECTAGYVTSSAPLGADAAVAPFRDLLKARRRDEGDRLRAWLSPLAGKDLACWCPLDEPCHADVLLEIANGGTP
jgi:hypothetical protein